MGTRQVLLVSGRLKAPIHKVVIGLVVAGLSVGLFAGLAPAAVGLQERSGAPLGVHRPPVDAPIIDRFRPPPEPWLPGNRGLEYGVQAGDLVRASAAGSVTFAGVIGAAHYVTIAHDASLSTTYSYLAEVVVSRGDRVRQGQVIAVAGDTFHFGARFDGRYIDPERLFSAIPVRRVFLID